MSFHFVTLTLLALFSSTSAFRWGRCPTVPTVEDFDVTKYYGKWYEIARSDNIPFENGARCVSAEYQPTWGRKITVYNVGTVDGEDGPEVREASGEAWVPDEDYPAKFRVKLSKYSYGGNYWVIDTDYDNYAIVFSCSRVLFFNVQYWWILGRTPRLDNDSYHHVNNFFDELDVEVDWIVNDNSNCGY